MSKLKRVVHLIGYAIPIIIPIVIASSVLFKPGYIIFTDVTVSKLASANSCERTYGGGLICDRGFRVNKEVKVGSRDSSNEYSDSVTVQKGETFTFRIKVKNVGDVDGEDLNLVDILPDELKLVRGDLTHEISTIDNGDTREFTIEAVVKDSEFESGKTKCVTNTAKLKGDLNEDGNKETLDSDTAVVCYGKTIKELPKTGSEDFAAAILGAGMILAGVGIRTVKRFVNKRSS